MGKLALTNRAPVCYSNPACLMQVLDSNRITLTWGSSSHELFYTVWFVNKPGRLTWQALKNETHVCT